MPHVALVPFTGLRVRNAEMLELGMSLPGFRQRADALQRLPALGLLTLAGMTPDSWQVSYHPAEDVGEAFVQRVLAQNPTLVAVSALTASIEDAYHFCERIREAGVPTVLGGLHASVCPEEAGRFSTSVVVGEGERVWDEVLADGAAGQLRQCYGETRGVREVGWPVPRFDLLGAEQLNRFTLQTERGCPLACDFCGASRLISRHRLKPLERIEEELRAIRAIDRTPWLELADDNTFIEREDSPELLELLGQSGARWFTEADWRFGEQTEFVRRLSRSGCVQVLVGIESLVFRYPGMGGKRDSLARITRAVERIQESGVVVNGCFIVGADGETADSLARLGQFILDSPLAEIQLTLQTPFPGTGLYERLKHEGRLLANRGWSSYTLFDVTFQPDALSVDELENGFKELLKQVFSSSAAARRARLRRQVWSRNSAFHRPPRGMG